MKAVIYARVSTDEQGISLEAQVKILKQYCDFKGLEVVDVFTEAISGSIPLELRPEGSRMLRLLKAEQIQHVVTHKLDRLFRNTIDALQQIEAWEKNKITLHIVDQNIVTGTAESKFFLGILAQVSQLERDMIRKRTKTALQHKKQKLEAYSKTPIGFSRVNKHLVVNEEEMQIVKYIFSLHKKFSYWKIAELLNKQNIKTKEGKKWYPATIRYIVNNKELYKNYLESEVYS